MSTKNSTTLFLAILLALMSGIADAQKITSFNLKDLLSKNKLEIVSASHFVGYTEDGKDAIGFDIQEQLAWLSDVSFSNGEIEVDLEGKDAFQNSFLGIAFHGIDNSTYDAVYFRPFNFQTTDSVRHIHAVQYISRPDYPWERLRKEQNGKYEKAINPAPNPNDWFHARIVVLNYKIAVYVNGSKTPSLEVAKLSSRTTGKIGIWLNGSFANFANLTIKTF